MTFSNQIVIVIPIYNATNQLDILHNLLLEHKKLAQLNFFLVDDSSKIDLSEKLDAIKKSFKNVRYVKLKKNVGIHLSTLIGIKNSTEKIILTLDQDFIGLIPRLYEFLKKENLQSLELKYYVIRKKRTLLRAISSKITLLTINLFGGFKLKGVYSVRLFKRELLEKSNINRFYILDLSFSKKLNIEYFNTGIKIDKNKSEVSFFKLIIIYLKIVIEYTHMIEFFFFLSLFILYFSEKNKQILISSIFLSIILILKILIRKNKITNFKEYLDTDKFHYIK